MKPEILLWIYSVVLLAGGIYGFVKVKSTVSLVTSLVFAALLIACALGTFGSPFVADAILTVLVIVFAKRFQKTRKLMPAGVLTLLTIAVLLIRAMMLLG